MAGKRVLVTGVTGLTGASIGRMLLEKGYSVRGIVRNPNSKDSKAIAATGVELVAGDISDLDSVLVARRSCGTRCRRRWSDSASGHWVSGRYSRCGVLVFIMGEGK